MGWFFFCGLEHCSSCGLVHPAGEINVCSAPEKGSEK